MITVIKCVGVYDGCLIVQQHDGLCGHSIGDDLFLVLLMDIFRGIFTLSGIKLLSLSLYLLLGHSLFARLEHSWTSSRRKMWDISHWLNHFSNEIPRKWLFRSNTQHFDILARSIPNMVIEFGFLFVHRNRYEFRLKAWNARNYSSNSRLGHRKIMDGLASWLIPSHAESCFTVFDRKFHPCAVVAMT